MEEILASIRRIISDENSAAAQPAAAAPVAPAPAAKPAAPPPAAKKAAPPPPPPPAAEEEEAEVLELTEMVEAPQDEFQKAEVAADVMFRDPELMREPPSMSAPARMDEQLMSQHASTAVSAAFDRIAAPMFSGDSRTVDDLVREMLRPLLKTWLEDNLPSLVERLVRAEIERVSRGR